MWGRTGVELNRLFVGGDRGGGVVVVVVVEAGRELRADRGNLEADLFPWAPGWRGFRQGALGFKGYPLQTPVFRRELPLAALFAPVSSGTGAAELVVVDEVMV